MPWRAAAVRVRHRPTPDVFAPEDSGIAFFLRDAVAQVLKSRPERPLEEIHRYFKQCAAWSGGASA